MQCHQRVLISAGYSQILAVNVIVMVDIVFEGTSPDVCKHATAAGLILNGTERNLPSTLTRKISLSD
eukprot:scaffold334768_cov39-Prasinocladus_malaysianus.AAC.2